MGQKGQLIFAYYLFALCHFKIELLYYIYIYNIMKYIYTYYPFL